MTVPDTLTLGARGSDLARVQAETVRTMLLSVRPELTIVMKTITTEGDRNRTAPLSSFGGRGAFVNALETALVHHEIDAAVHSLKDLPSRLPDGLALAATPVREDPRDALAIRRGFTLDSLPANATIGTGSDRRARQTARNRPGFTFAGIRGNVETRLRKLDDGGFDGIMLAAAGLKRLGLEHRIAEYLDPSDIVPAPCQGIIGIECRSGDTKTIAIFGGIENADIRVCADVERAFIATLGLGCHEPVAAYARIEDDAVAFTGYVCFQESGRELRETIRAPRGDAVDAVIALARTFIRDDAENGRRR